MRARLVGSLVLAGLLVAAGCSDDGDDGASGDDGGATTTEAPDSNGGAITIDDLETRCDDLTGIVTDLRGEAPDTAEPATTPLGPVDVSIDGATYRNAACIYGYTGDTFSDPNRVTLRIDEGDTDVPAVRDAMFESLSFDTEIPDLGDEARYLTQSAVDTHANVHVLVGDTVLTVRVDITGDIFDDFLAEEPMAEAARAFLERVDV